MSEEESLLEISSESFVCVCVHVCVCVCVINNEDKFAGLCDECRDRVLFQHKNKSIIMLLLVDTAVLLLDACFCNS